MSDIFKDAQINRDHDQLTFQCIQELMADALDTVTINYFETSIQSLVELFGNKRLYIFSNDQDEANQQLNIHLFVLDNITRAEHHCITLNESYEEAVKWLVIGDNGDRNYSSFKPEQLETMFDVDFGSERVMLNHFWFEGGLVGGIGYACSESEQPFCELVLPVLKVLTILLVKRQRQIELEGQVKTYKNVLNLVSQRVFWKNKKSTYLGANSVFAKDAGLDSPEDLIGKTDYELFPEEADIYREDDNKTMESKKQLLNFEEPQTTRSGNTIWLRTSKMPMYNNQNEVVGILGSYDEITELKQAQFELQQAKDELEDRVKRRTKDLQTSNTKLAKAINELKQTQGHLIESEKMAALGNLVAGVAHEVNTPLGVSVTTASYINDRVSSLQAAFSAGKLGEEDFVQFCIDAKSSSQILLDNLSRASSLIKNFKQIAVDQSYDQPRVVKLYDYVTSILSTLSPVLRTKNVELIVDIDNIIEVRVCPGTFAQIITNMTENAIKHAFTDDKHRVFKIQCTQDKKDLTIRFIDNGIGISEYLKGKIFNPFFTTKRNKGGSGLGLSIVYNIVYQQFLGKINCISEVGSGAEFIIKLPNIIHSIKT
jgi:two-component system autoinducer 2 sensor kinase/phosphatase LuxQ